MSTQHPDNVRLPFFAHDNELAGEDEIQEAYYVFSHLCCDEQMWDCEGKEVDNYVVKKLLTKYEHFFKKTQLGKDVFVTLRVPNPTVEKAEGKILLETLESIPRSFDAAKLFYGREATPIFEVILPMTASADCLDRIYRYYSDFVVGKKNTPFKKGDITIAEWIGEFKPKKINVIPLFEDSEHMLNAHQITKKYLMDKEVDYQRVFLARSDPAMNYGLISAVLLNKIALCRLYELSEKINIKIYPIIGVGSAPFRGNLKPHTVDRVIKEYPSVHTFSIQSSFKYDYSPEEVIKGIRGLHANTPSTPDDVDEKRCLKICSKYISEYRKQIRNLAPVINRAAKYIPSRRKRKLHIGLFGYSRNIGRITLPRAITFTAALYSIGLPPEILGLSALNKNDMLFIKRIYANFEKDLNDAIKYLNPESGFLPPEIKDSLKRLDLNFNSDKEYKDLTSCIIDSLDANKTDNLIDYILQTASYRNFLG